MVGVYEGGVGKLIRITKQRVLKVGHPESALHVPIKSSDKLCFSDYGHFVIMEDMGMDIQYIYVYGVTFKATLFYSFGLSHTQILL